MKLIALLIAVLFVFSTFSCNGEDNNSERHKNINQRHSMVQPKMIEFLKQKSDDFWSLSKEYGFPTYSFDPEIFISEDFETIALGIASLAFKETEVVNRGETEDEEQFFVTFSLEGKQYDILSGDRHWVETDSLLKQFNRILQEKGRQSVLKEETGAGGGNNVIVVFANADKLAEAIRKGFPCCADFSTKIKADVKILPSSFTEIQLMMEEVPNFDSIRSIFTAHLNYLKNLSSNEESEEFTIHQINLVEGYNSKDLNIYINAMFKSIIKVHNRALYFKERDVDLILLYTLLKHYPCEVFYHDKKSDEWQKQEGEKVIEKIEDIFSKT